MGKEVGMVGSKGAEAIIPLKGRDGVSPLGLNSTGPRPGPKPSPKRGSEIISVSVSKSEAFPFPFPRLAGASIT